MKKTIIAILLLLSLLLSLASCDVFADDSDDQIESSENIKDSNSPEAEPTEPAPTEAPTETEPAPTEAPTDTEPAPTEAPTETEPAPDKGPDEPDAFSELFGYKDITEEKRKEIEEAWLKDGNGVDETKLDGKTPLNSVPLTMKWLNINSPVQEQVRYYGEVNGYSVIRVFVARQGWTWIVELDINVPGVGSFDSNVTFEIYLYKDGVFTDVRDAYAKGYVTADQVSELVAVHEKVERYVFDAGSN